MRVFKLRQETFLLGLVIIFSASFVRALYSLILMSLTRRSLENIIFFIYLTVAVLFVKNFTTRDIFFARKISSAFIMLIMFIIVQRLPLMEERVHVLEYAVLGFFIAGDLKEARFNFACVIFYIFIFGLFDELFQYFLPQRYCDMRDVRLNFISGLFGAIQYYCLKKQVLKEG